MSVNKHIHKHIVIKVVDSEYYQVLWTDQVICSKWNHTFVLRRNEKNQQKLVLACTLASFPRLIEHFQNKTRERKRNSWLCFSTRVFLRLFSIIKKHRIICNNGHVKLVIDLSAVFCLKISMAHKLLSWFIRIIQP